MSVPRPPRFAEALLGLVLARRDRAHVLGDLQEQYGARVRARGRKAANRWYRVQVVRAVGPSLRRRTESRGTAIADLAGEIRVAVRSLVRRPTSTAAAVLTLGIGIASVTAIFSVTDAVLLQPLPYPGSDRLATVWNTYDTWRNHEVLGPYWDRISLSWPEFVDWRERQGSFDEVAAYGTGSMTLTGSGDPRRVPVGVASASLFPLLGVRMHLGRSFTEDEIGEGAPRIGVLSYELWRDRYGRDRGVVGRSISLDGRPFEIVGVLPPGFDVRALGPFDQGSFGRHSLWLP
ncbi:MAG: ABC transporter permease, partial [Gemmatimonadota bacterium]